MCIINSDIILYLPSCMAGKVLKIVPYRSIEPFLTKYGINRPFKTNFKGSSAERPNMGKNQSGAILNSSLSTVGFFTSSQRTA